MAQYIYSLNNLISMNHEFHSFCKGIPKFLFSIKKVYYSFPLESHEVLPQIADNMSDFMIWQSLHFMMSSFFPVIKIGWNIVIRSWRPKMKPSVRPKQLFTEPSRNRNFGRKYHRYRAETEPKPKHYILKFPASFSTKIK